MEQAANSLSALAYCWENYCFSLLSLKLLNWSYLNKDKKIDFGSLAHDWQNFFPNFSELAKFLQVSRNYVALSARSGILYRVPLYHPIPSFPATDEFSPPIRFSKNACAWAWTTLSCSSTCLWYGVMMPTSSVVNRGVWPPSRDCTIFTTYKKMKITLIAILEQAKTTMLSNCRQDKITVDNTMLLCQKLQVASSQLNCFVKITSIQNQLFVKNYKYSPLLLLLDWTMMDYCPLSCLLPVWENERITITETTPLPALPGTASGIVGAATAPIRTVSVWGRGQPLVLALRHRTAQNIAPVDTREHDSSQPA